MPVISVDLRLLGIMSASLSLQVFGFDNNKVNHSGYDIKQEPLDNRTIRSLTTNNLNHIMRFHSIEWQGQQQSQLGAPPQGLIQLLHQPQPMPEDNQYIYASSGNSSNIYQLQSNFSTPESNPLVPTSLSAPSTFYSNTPYLSSNLSTNYSDSYSDTNEQKSPETKQHNIESFKNTSTKCSCKSKAKRIPRPRNAFILYRQKYHQTVFGDNPERKSNSEISRELGNRWRNLPPEEREHWNLLAKEEKANHAKKYPDYRYIPRRNGKKDCSFCNTKKSHDSKMQQSSMEMSTNIPINVPMVSGMYGQQNTMEQPSQQLQQQMQQLHQPIHQNASQLPGQLPDNSQRIGYVSLYNQLGQPGQSGQLGQINSMNAMNQVNIMTQMNQLGQMNAMAQMNQMGQMNQIGHMSATNSINQMGQPNQIHPGPQINSVGPIGQLAQQTNPNHINSMGITGSSNPGNYQEGTPTNQVTTNASVALSLPQNGFNAPSGAMISDKSYERMYQQQGDQLQAESNQRFDSLRATGGQYNTYNSGNNGFQKQYPLQPLSK